MKNITLRQRTLFAFAAVALGLGGVTEIASAATGSSTRNLDQLASSRILETNETIPSVNQSSDSELVAFKFKKHHGRKFKKFKKHHHGALVC